MKNNKLIVKTKSKTYPIYFGNNILNTVGRLIKKKLPNVKKYASSVTINYLKFY